MSLPQDGHGCSKDHWNEIGHLVTVKSHWHSPGYKLGSWERILVEDLNHFNELRNDDPKLGLRLERLDKPSQHL